MLLKRLKAAGAERRLYQTQFGFRSGYSMTDALFIARRAWETCAACKRGQLSMVALDWAKAFEKIAPPGVVESTR